MKNFYHTYFLLTILVGLFGPGESECANGPSDIGKLYCQCGGSPYPIPKGQMTKTACEAQVKKQMEQMIQP